MRSAGRADFPRLDHILPEERLVARTAHRVGCPTTWTVS